jgi:transposase-like protein
MGKKEAVPNRRYTEEFKTEAVRLALSTGGNGAAKRPGIPPSTMTNWVRQSREGTLSPGAGPALRLRYVHPAHRLRLIGPGQQAGPNRRPVSFQMIFEFGHRQLIYARRATVRKHPLITPRIRFLIVAPALCLRLPSDSQSPRTPLPGS